MKMALHMSSRLKELHNNIGLLKEKKFPSKNGSNYVECTLLSTYFSTEVVNNACYIENCAPLRPSGKETF